MEIKNFDNFRIGGKHVFADVKAVNTHSEYGFMVEGYKRITKRIEVREKEGSIAMFCSRFEKIKLPEWWEDSNILFSSTEDK